MDTNESAPAARRRRPAKPADDQDGAAAGTTRPAGEPAANPSAAAGATPGRGATDRAQGGTRAGERRQVRDGIGLAEATLASLDLQRGVIGRVSADDVTVTQGAIGAARAETLHLELGGLGAAMANQARVSQAGVGTLVAGDVHLEQAIVRTMLARDVAVERPSLVGLLLARRVSGDVRVLFDWRGAILFGAVFGLVARLGRRRR